MRTHMGGAVATLNRKSSVYVRGTPPSAPVVDPDYPGWRPAQQPNPDRSHRASQHSASSAAYSTAPVIWELEHRGSWRQFSKAESAEMNRIMSSPSGRGTWEARNTTYEGDVFKMQQTNVSSGNIRVIRMRVAGSEERPVLMKWADKTGGWEENRDLDLKVIIALRHGQRVEHCDSEFQVNFADNCLENGLSRYAFQPSNNMFPLSRQMDWGLFQWQNQDETWVDFGNEENVLIEKAWKRGDVSVCFVQNGHPMELSFLSWTLLNLNTHATCVVQIGHRCAVGENKLAPHPVFEYHHKNQWRCFVERVDTLLTQCFDRTQSDVTYCTRHGNFSANLESMVATNLTSFVHSRMRRKDGKTLGKANVTQKTAKKETEKKKDDDVPPNPFYTPRFAARWKKEQEKATENAHSSATTKSKDTSTSESERYFSAKRKFEKEFPPRRDAGPCGDARQRRQTCANDDNCEHKKDKARTKFGKEKSKEWDNADFGSSKEAPRPPAKLPEPTDAEGECKEIKAKLMDKLSLCLDERKIFFKDLQRELHPDKNNKDNATQLFQYLMSNKGWFLLGPKPPPSH